jgi:FkbM family methyltransferase
MINKIIKSVKFRSSKFFRKITKHEDNDLKTIVNNLNVNIETIVDIGANVGNTVKMFRHKFPNSTIHAFEPNPTVFEKLKNNCKNINRLNLNNSGVGDKKGILTLNRHSNSGATSFKNPNSVTNPTYSAKIIDQIQVPVVTVNDYVNENSLSNIDLLKIDVEGFEMEVINGISEDYLKNNIKIILIEANLIEKMIGQGLIEDIIAILRKNNFTLFNIYDLQESNNLQLYIVNLIFVNNHVLKIN